MYRSVLIALFIALTATPLTAQERAKVKFGKVTADDFKQKSYALDTSASAVIVADIGSTQIVGNDKGSFSLEFKNYRRAHVLNKNGYEIGNVEVNIYTNGDMEEELKSLKAVTYNLENGKVVETKLDSKAGVFKDRINKNWVVRKFTFPNLREGSIIEYEYKIQSDFIFNLQPWTFQGLYPCLWSEYVVSMPEFFNYISIIQGYLPYSIKDQKDHLGNFTVNEENRGSGTASLTSSNNRISFDAGVTDFRWVIKDVPALREENYTSTLRNHASRIEFQLSELREPVFVKKRYMNTWQETAQDLLGREDFGKTFLENTEWTEDIITDLTKGITDPLAKARKIYNHIRDNISCTNYSRIYTEHSLRSVWKNKTGTVAEINLMLVAFLRQAGLFADPVLLSTRSHGWTYPEYPLIDKFNYVVARVVIGGKYYNLDASDPELGFGRLGSEAYNGHARIIDTDAKGLELPADLLLESSVTSVLMINNDKGSYSGSIQQDPGYYESYRLRRTIKEKGKNGYFDGLKKDFGSDVVLSETVIDSLTNTEEPLSIRYKFETKLGDEDIIYFNPMLGQAWKENPFKSATRLYPVEMPYTIDQTYLLRMDVPAGYVVDELPKQLIIKLNAQEDGVFEYRLSEANGSIALRSRLRIKKATFSSEEYDTLREFFNLVVKKHSEQIVFKKKK